MRRFFIFFLLAMTSCGGEKTIPDDELVEIFRDIYLTNAVADVRPTLRLDSLSIYEPLFARRGYTGEDLRYTIGNFAGRKSASISVDIVGRAIDLLRAEGSIYTRGLAARDSITNMARERFRERVLTEGEIVVRRIADTGRLRIALPARAGDYRVEFGYLVDTTEDESLGVLRTSLNVLNSRGRVVASNSYRLGRTGHGTASMLVTADTTARRLVVDLNPYSTSTTKRPSFTIDCLRVTYYLPPAVAFDSLEREWFDYFVSTPR